jgi:membrane-bound lytic murein transglycosylase
MRPERKKLKFDEESVNSLLQEIYNDSHNIRAKITRLFTKWEQKVKEGGEIAALGENISKLIVAEAKTVDQKLVLLRYLKEVVFAKESESNSENKESVKLTSKDRNALIKQVSEEIHKSR